MPAISVISLNLNENTSPHPVQPIPPGPYATPQNYGAPFTPAPPTALHMGGANYSQMPPGSFISGRCLKLHPVKSAVKQAGFSRNCVFLFHTKCFAGEDTTCQRKCGLCVCLCACLCVSKGAATNNGRLQRYNGGHNYGIGGN